MNTGYINLAPVDGKQFDERCYDDFDLLLFIIYISVLALAGWGWLVAGVVLYLVSRKH